MIEMIVKVPSGMAGAESLLHVSDRRGQMDGGTVIQQRIRIGEQQVQKGVSDADSGNRSGIGLLCGHRSGNEIERNAGVDSKVMREVVAQGRSHVVDARVTAVVPLEASA